MYKNSIIPILVSVFIITIALIPSQLPEAQAAQSTPPTLTLGAPPSNTVNVGTDAMTITVTWTDSTTTGAIWKVTDGVTTKTITYPSSKSTIFTYTTSAAKESPHCFTVQRTSPASTATTASDPRCSPVQPVISPVISPVIPPIPPIPPFLLQTGLTQVKISWTQTGATFLAASPSGYKVERVLSPGFLTQVCSTGTSLSGPCSSSFIQFTPSPSTATTYTNTGLVAGKEYCYEIQTAWPSPRSYTMDSDRQCIKLDTTVPVISSAIVPATPLANSNGWYNTSPRVVWTITESESTILSKTGCVDTTFDSDTPTGGTTLTCSATSGGGPSATTSVTIFRDATIPVITLTHPATLYLQVNDVYTEPGVVASDVTSGVDGAVVVSGAVDTSTPGAYIIKYNVKDKAGNAADEVTRTVSVVKFLLNPAYEIEEPTLGSLRDTFTIEDFVEPGSSISARIYTAEDPGFSVPLSEIGGDGIFVSTPILFTSGPTSATDFALHVVPGSRVLVDYQGLTSDPPGVAGASFAGTGSIPPPSDRCKFDSDGFRIETSTKVTCTDTPNQGAGLSVTIRNDKSGGGTISLTLIETPPGSGIYATTYPIMLSKSRATNTSPVTDLVLNVDVPDTISAGPFTGCTISSCTAHATILPTPSELTLIGTQPSATTNPDCITTFGSDDIDKDGWCDSWEPGTAASGANGKPLKVTLTNGGPVVYTMACSRLLTAPGAPTDSTNPVTCPQMNKKDILLEIDYMTNHKPDNGALMDVINSFKAQNQNLFIQVDQDAGFHQAIMPYYKANEGNNALNPGTIASHSVQGQKEELFGNATEKALANGGSNILTGKKQAAHWMFFGHTLSDVNSGGYAEICGNDAATGLGAYSGYVGTRDQQAATILHELGHNICARHGGDDDVNGKPNYISVMNYALMLPQESGGFLSKSSGAWQLSLSSYKFNSIYENNLAETVAGGITGATSPPSKWTVVGVANGGTPQLVQTKTAIDWNFNNAGVADGQTGISQTVNRILSVGIDDTAISTLVSSNDYSRSYDFSAYSGTFATGLATVPHTDNDPNFVNLGTTAPPSDDTADPIVLVAPSNALHTSNEGDHVTGIPLATVIDYDSSVITIAVNWGDGTPVEIQTINDADLNFGIFNIVGDHTYADDTPTGTPFDQYTVTIKVTNDRGGESIVTLPTTVNNLAPVVTAIADPPAINEGDTFNLALASIATFADAGVLDTHTAAINWGDGSPIENCTGGPLCSLTQGAGSGSVAGSHKYVDDNPTATPSDKYTVTITVTDDDGGVGFATLKVTVNNVAPVVTAAGNPAAINAGATINLASIATFTDVGVLDTHTAAINWGDGSSAGVVTEGGGSGTVSGSHLYSTAGTYTVTITVTDDDSGVGSGTLTVTVNSAFTVEFTKIHQNDVISKNANPAHLDIEWRVRDGAGNIIRGLCVNDHNVLSPYKVTITPPSGPDFDGTTKTKTVGNINDGNTAFYKEDSPNCTIVDYHQIKANLPVLGTYKINIMLGNIEIGELTITLVA